MTKLPEHPVDKKPEEKKNGREGMVVRVLRVIGGFLSHNWAFKLISVVIAIVLWAGLITQDPTLTREKAFTDVTIAISGEEAMKRNGFIVVSDLNALVQDARIRVEVPQMQYNASNVSSYNVRIDLSKITETGTQQLKVQSTSSSTWGTVIEVYPETIELEVEEYITRYRIPVTVNTVGTAPAGYYAATPTMDPPLVAVSGPRSLVEKVAGAEATLELSSLPSREGLARTAVPFRLTDSQGNTIESKLLQVTSESVLIDSVVVEQNIYSMKELNLSELGLIKGEVATGYEIKTVTVTPAVVTAAGKADNLAALETLYADSSVDVTGASTSFTEQIKVRKPSELTYLSTDTITVAVEVGPVIRGKTFDDVKVITQGIAAGYEAVMAQTKVSVTVSGSQLWVERLRSAALTLSCDATGLTEGIYDLPVLCKVEGGEDIPYDLEVLPATVQVEIRKK